VRARHDVLPIPDERSRPFFDGAREGRLVLQRCRACHTWQHPVRSRCTRCGGADLEWAQASGRARLYSWGRLHRAYLPQHEGRLPIDLAVVDLEEGVRMSSNLVGAAPAEIRAGLPLQVDFERVSPEVAMPVFRPARS
jgi:hypothetical protein